MVRARTPGTRRTPATTRQRLHHSTHTPIKESASAGLYRYVRDQAVTLQRTIQNDWLGRPILLQEPESGQTTYSYAYNGTGLVVTRKKPKANQLSASTLTTTTYQYDALSRLVNVSYDDGVTPTKTFAYDA